MRFDYEGAIRYYDEAAPPGQLVLSDIVFHVYRGHAYWRVERNEEALRDAQLVYRMLHRDPTLHVPPERYLPPDLQMDVMYAFILPVLQDLDAPEFEPALEEFMALPAQDWVSYANRAAVMVEIGDAPRAFELSSRALALAPDEPANLNNHCFIQLNLGRPEQALPYCERAVAAAPQIADIRHSISAVFAALGRCDEAEREIAEARRLDPATVEYQRPIACQAR